MKKREQIILPALRGVMGDWVFYSCLMDIKEISERVRYADKVHENKNKNKILSGMIQRRIEPRRREQIATYLGTQDERFFNSLVIATYGGQPNWRGLSDVRGWAAEADLKNLSDETMESLGFLMLSGDEKLFAIDGQHRLAGIKRAVKEGMVKDPYDTLSVIFVAHQTTVEGLERTRRLFTTLNKTARPVSKGDIVALDEDDVMAICVRRLIEKTPLFKGERVAFVGSNNMPTSNSTSLTTIVNLYDLLTILFTKTRSDLKKGKYKLQNKRLADEALEAYFKYAKEFFNLLKKHFPELEEFFVSKDTTDTIKRYRGRHGGSALFRPIGLDVFVKVIAGLNNDHSLAEAVRLAAKLPRELSVPPFAELMWNTSTNRIVNDHRVTLREVLMYMLGYSKFSDEVLTERYRKAVGNENALLPKRVV